MSIVTFYNIFDQTIPPMPADKSALGTAPAAAFQYCEAMRTASAFGWYIFPPKDIRLRWDGREVFYYNGEEWDLLDTVSLGSEYEEYWNQNAPTDFVDRLPNFMQKFFVPGIVQIWTGLFVSTAPDWSLLFRPLANTLGSNSYSTYEGLVETDQFKPCPLFINIRLLGTEHEISLPKIQPLFQVQPIHRSCYSVETLNAKVVNGFSNDKSIEDGFAAKEWHGLGQTTRLFDPSGGEIDIEIGNYKQNVRKRMRQKT